MPSNKCQSRITHLTNDNNIDESLIFDLDRPSVQVTLAIDGNGQPSEIVSKRSNYLNPPLVRSLLSWTPKGNDRKFEEMLSLEDKIKDSTYRVASISGLSLNSNTLNSTSTSQKNDLEELEKIALHRKCLDIATSISCRQKKEEEKPVYKYPSIRTCRQPLQTHIPYSHAKKTKDIKISDYTTVAVPIGNDHVMSKLNVSPSRPSSNSIGSTKDRTSKGFEMKAAKYNSAHDLPMPPLFS